jgi:hypothetical protein
VSSRMFVKETSAVSEWSARYSWIIYWSACYKPLHKCLGTPMIVLASYHIRLDFLFLCSFRCILRLPEWMDHGVSWSAQVPTLLHCKKMREYSSMYIIIIIIVILRFGLKPSGPSKYMFQSPSSASPCASLASVPTSSIFLVSTGSSLFD